MFGKRIQLFRMFGFSVRVDLSWIVIAVLIAWSMSEYFGTQGERSALARWTMGIAAALGLFASIVLHELSHSLVARRFGLQMKGITLFIFGGVAEMPEEPRSPAAEFAMAIAGPVSSVLIAVAVFGLQAVWLALGGLSSVAVVLGWLWTVNLVLAVFNLLPGYPLDGGRVLRAGLWAWKGDLRWATRVASRLGGGLGLLMILLGVWFMISGNVGQGLWWFLIGMFIRFAARSGYEQVMVRTALAGEKVRRFMNPQPVTVGPQVPLDELVDQYVYKYHHKMFPVVSDGRLVGCISTRHLREVPREQWPALTVGQAATSCGVDNTIGPDEDAVEALAKMNRNQTGRLLVVRGDRLLGIITLRDLLKFLSLKAELEQEA